MHRESHVVSLIYILGENMIPDTCNIYFTPGGDHLVVLELEHFPSNNSLERIWLLFYLCSQRYTTLKITHQGTTSFLRIAIMVTV